MVSWCVKCALSDIGITSYHGPKLSNLLFVVFFQILRTKLKSRQKSISLNILFYFVDPSDLSGVVSNFFFLSLFFPLTGLRRDTIDCGAVPPGKQRTLPSVSACHQIAFNQHLISAWTPLATSGATKATKLNFNYSWMGNQFLNKMFPWMTLMSSEGIGWIGTSGQTCQVW